MERGRHFGRILRSQEVNSSNGKAGPPYGSAAWCRDGVAPSIFGLIERGIAREPELAAQMRGRVVFRFEEEFSPLRIVFRPSMVVIEDGDLRRPDLVITGRLPTSSTSPRCRCWAAASKESPTRAHPAAERRSPASHAAR